jgi:hypothetical protein
MRTVGRRSDFIETADKIGMGASFQMLLAFVMHATIAPGP